MPSLAGLRIRPIGLFISLASCICLTLWFTFKASDDGIEAKHSTMLPSWLIPKEGTHGDLHHGDDDIPQHKLETYIHRYLEELQASFSPVHDHVTYGLSLGDISLPAYAAELLSTYHDYLSPSSSSASSVPAYIPQALARLSFRTPRSPLPPAPKQIMTTEKTVEDLPMEFSRWREVMPDWEIKYFDDEELLNWVKAAFGGTRAEQIWKDLPRQVLKTDVFRYMAMLVEGGIYTDRKRKMLKLAAPVIHVDQWGKPYNDTTPSLLTRLTDIASLGAEEGSVSPDRDDEPGLVVSIEADAIEFGWHSWRQIGLQRAVQITQWTFLARPGHPVFLDVLGRTLRKSEEVAARLEEAKEKGEEYVADSALEWTGPGVFTDCVHRYLLARYGFRPEELISHKNPFRVGDVLILPAGSFSSLTPFDPNIQQRQWAAVWHGFLGRWRGDDPAQAEFERLKKIQEEEEAASLREEEAIAEREKEESAHSEY